MAFQEDTRLSLKIDEFVGEIPSDAEMVVSISCPQWSTAACTMVRASPEYLAFLVAHILNEIGDRPGGLAAFFADVKMIMKKMEEHPDF